MSTSLARGFLISAAIGTLLWMLTAIVFPTLMDLGLFFIVAVALGLLYWRWYGTKLAAIVVGIFLVFYSAIPSLWTWITSRTFAADVVYAGTDEERGTTAFVVDLRQRDGGVIEARTRDVLYPPFYWHVWSGTTRRQLRVAAHDRIPVCVTLTGVRVPWYFPNVLRVDDINSCEES